MGFLIAGLVVREIAKKRNQLAEEVRRQRNEYEHDLELGAHVKRQILPLAALLPGSDISTQIQPVRLLGETIMISPTL